MHDEAGNSKPAPVHLTSFNFISFVIVSSFTFSRSLWKNECQFVCHIGAHKSYIVAIYRFPAGNKAVVLYIILTGQNVGDQSKWAVAATHHKACHTRMRRVGFTGRYCFGKRRRWTAGVHNDNGYRQRLLLRRGRDYLGWHHTRSTGLMTGAAWPHRRRILPALGGVHYSGIWRR